MRLTLQIPGDIRAAETARNALNCFATHVSPQQLETVRLLVNELVTNSLLHACMSGEPIDLEVEAHRGSVKAAVRDPGAGFDVPQREPDPEATSGRGLFLVQALADHWGVEPTPSTCVWFEVLATSALEETG
jgi:anti-sigma regulatory factor (Ser/Thr protein kinase)